MLVCSANNIVHVDLLVSDNLVFSSFFQDTFTRTLHEFIHSFKNINWCNIKTPTLGIITAVVLPTHPHQGPLCFFPSVFFPHLIYFTQHHHFSLHPCCCKWHAFILFDHWVIFHDVCIPLLLDAFICSKTLVVSISWL